MGDGCFITVHRSARTSMASLLRIKADEMRDRTNDPWFARLADPIDDGNVEA
jgi:hypothetical protein